MPTLNAETRTAGKKQSARLRKNEKVPAVYYGRKEDAYPIAVSQNEFIRTWHEAGESTVIDLATPQGTKSVLIQDIQFDPVTEIPKHIDFYVVEAGVEMNTTVPLEFEGVAPAVKEKGGILVKVLHEVEIKTLPQSLPSSIEVDISTLTDFDSQITVADIPLPEGVEVVNEPDAVVAAISEAQEEEEAEDTDISSVEVEQKGKQEEEEA